MCRSVRIDGSATPTIETSSASRKSAPQRTSSAPHARALSFPESSCCSCVTEKLLWSNGAVDLDPPKLVRYCSTVTVQYLFDARQTICRTGERARWHGD